MFVDAVGFSEAVAKDERAGLQAMQSAREDRIEPAVRRHSGTVLKWLGDGAMALFPTVTACLSAACEMQSIEGELALRIGVHLGEVELEHGDAFGSDVNLASRLEQLARPGGICVSEQARLQVRDVPIELTPCGPRLLKGFSTPVEVWHWPGPLEAVNVPSPTSHLPKVLVSLFSARSTDPVDVFLAEGLTEDLIARLSRSRGIAVLSRYVTFGDATNALPDRARDLGAGFLVEGAVQRMLERVRISARLTDVEQNRLLWSERYDGHGEEMFEVQDRACQAIAAAIEPEMLEVERTRFAARDPVDLSAWQAWQRGFGILWKYRTSEYPQAISLFRRAIELDPAAAPARAGLAYALAHAYKEGLVDGGPEVLDEALLEARRATALDPRDPFSFVSLGRTHLARREYDPALAAYSIALELNPSQDTAHMGMAYALCMVGRAGESLRHIDAFDLLTPTFQQNPTIQTVRSFALSMTGRHQEALSAAIRAAELPNAPHWAHVAAALAYAKAGKTREAAEAIEAARQIRPDLSEEALRVAYPFVDGAEAQEVTAKLLSSTDIFRQRLEQFDTKPEGTTD